MIVQVADHRRDGAAPDGLRAREGVEIGAVRRRGEAELRLQGGIVGEPRRRLLEVLEATVGRVGEEATRWGRYEEAGAQGLLAGINAALAARGEAGWCPRRDEAYLGVLVDDLVTRGVSEPYRMFTSRAEYRLQLREDNADLRLTEAGRRLGLVGDARWAAFSRKREAIERETQRLRALWATPANALGREVEAVLGVAVSRETSALDLIRRPELGYAALMRVPALGPGTDDAQVAEQVEIGVKYAGYLERQREEIARQQRHEDTAIPAGFDYAGVRGLSAEVQQKLERVRPQTLGQAQRIPGMTPAAISLLLVHLERQRRSRVA